MVNHIRAPRIRLLALDIDGTLLTSTHQISPATRAAVQEVSRRSVQVVLASARSPSALRLLMAELGISGFAIAYTGALLCRLSPDPRIPTQMVAERRMSRTSARAVLRRALVRGLSVGWYTGDIVHIPKWDAALRREFTLTGEQPIVTPKLATIGEAPHKLLCIAGALRLVPELHVLATDLPRDCGGQFSHTTYLEVTRQGVNKANALATLGQRLGIALTEMAALGDQENDIGMLQVVGVGIAMGNGIPAVQLAADWVTETNDRDGVAVAIERLRTTGRL
jgi:Cof subfamily protein (haloacid dehalogenase superfamily)